MALSVGTGVWADLWFNGVTNGTTAFVDTTDTPFGSTSTPSTQNPNITSVGSGVAGADLVTTIASWTDSGHVTLAAAASTSHTSAFTYGVGTGGTNGLKTLSITCSAAVLQGDSLVVCIDYPDGNSPSAAPTDTSGNTYVLAKSGTLSGFQGQSVYVAKNCAAAAAGTNKITATLTNNAGVATAIRVVPIHGADLGTPVVTTDFASASSGTAIASGAFSTTFKDTVVIAFPSVDSHVSAGGSGYTLSNNDSYGNSYETQIFSSIQTGITAQATQSSSGRWVMTTVVLHAALSLPGDPHDALPQPVTRRPKQIASASEDNAILARITAAALLGIGWVPSDVAPRGAGRAPWPEDPNIEARFVSLSKLGYATIDSDPRGKGRAPWPEDPTLKTVSIPVVLSSIASYAPDDPLPRRRPPLVSEPQGIGGGPGAQISTLGFEGLELPPRGLGRRPIDPDTVFSPTKPLLAIGWAPVESHSRARERRAPDPEMPTSDAKPLLSLGWISVDNEWRGKGRAAIPEDPTLESTKPLATTGWVEVEVLRRGAGRTPWPEDPTLETFMLRPIGWVESELAARGKGRLPLPEDPLLKTAQIAALPSASAWAPDDPLPRRREQRPPDPDPLLKATKPLLSLGWLTIEVEPRGKGRFAWPEDPSMLKATSPATFASMAAWAPQDPLPRARERRFPDPDPNLTATKPLGTLGWVELESSARARARAPAEEPIRLPSALLASLGWAEAESARRRASAPPLPEDLSLARIQQALPSIGWAEVEAPHRRAQSIPIGDEFLRARTTVALPSIGWTSVDSEPRGRGRYPWPEDSNLTPTVVVHLPSIGWMSIEVDRRAYGRPVAPEDPASLLTFHPTLLPLAASLPASSPSTAILPPSKPS